MNHYTPKKHWKQTLATMALLLLFSAVKANPVDLQTARFVGARFLNANITTPLRGQEELQLVKTYNLARGGAAFYIFNSPTGFVIVAADDCSTPILGYSEEGQFDIENIPIQLQAYLQGFVEQIQYGIENQIREGTIQREWDLVMTTGRLNDNRNNRRVLPMATALWGQGCYYNAMCPEDEGGPCGHVVTGCFATALGILLHSWGYPEQGTGSHSYTPIGYSTQTVNFGETTYDWAHMPEQLTPNSSQDEIDAVSTLLWHCGVAGNTAYSPHWSTGAPGSSFSDYFNFAPDYHWEYRIDDEIWGALLMADLDLGCPIFCSGEDLARSGHYYICDGYDVYERFHFNWGWNGEMNGYFALNALPYYYGGVADLGVAAYLNLHPNGGVIHQVIAAPSPATGGTVTGTSECEIGSLCTVTATANEGYSFMYWTEDDEMVSTQEDYSFRVRGNRHLVAHFGTPFHIDAVADLVEGGTVSGMGEYTYGSTCTLTATANEGYNFVCWRNADGNVGTTESTYTFTVTEPTTMTAVFAVIGEDRIAFADLNVKAICVANWDTDGDGDLSYAEAATVTDLGNAFSENEDIRSFEELRFFTGLTRINDSAFIDCINLRGNLYLPTSIVEIGDWAFFGCFNLSGNLTIPNSVTTIGELAFRCCNGFTGDLVIPNSVTTIKHSAFFRCNGFTGLILGDAVRTIGDYAFSDCYHITGDLNIPNSVTKIGRRAFYGCYGFTGDLTIGNSVISIGELAFAGCQGFTGSLTLGNSLDTIGSEAFMQCSGFTGDLIIPNSVTTIGNYAFINCTGFNGSLTISNSLTQINYQAFSHCSGFTGDLVIPNSVITIEDYAFSSCTGFNGQLTIGSSVSSIGNGAFYISNRFSSYACIAETPPTLGDNSFGPINGGGLNYPVYVPCGDLDAYESIHWGGFNNYIEMCPCHIGAKADPEEYGRVTGMGTYDIGTTVTLTATASPGFTFVNWTNNGLTVSTDSVYSFTASESLFLIAHFRANQEIDEYDAGITIHPNPVHDRLIVNAASPIRCCEVFDLTGQLLIRMSDCADGFGINVAHLPAGNYMIRLTFDQFVKTKTFIKE